MATNTTKSVAKPKSNQKNPSGAPTPPTAGAPMKFWPFLLEKIFPNLAIWFVSYQLIGKYLYPKISGATPIDWSTFFDLKGAIVFLTGVSLTIAIAYGVGKWNPKQLSWLFSRLRDEAVNAIVSVSSIGLLVGIEPLNLTILIGCIAGYFLAWFVH